MNTEPGEWIQAEKEFPRWIEHADNYPVNSYTSLRKSLHIYFRQQFHDILGAHLGQIFETLQPGELLSEDLYFRYDSKQVHEQMNDYSQAMYSLREFSRPQKNLQLLERFFNNEKEAVFEFYEKEFTKIASLIISNKGTVEDAKDVFHDALVILMDKYRWGSLSLESSPGSYLYAICRNLWYEHLRRLKKANNFKEVELHHYPDVAVDYYDEEPEQFDTVKKALDALGNPCKQLLELYYYRNHSWEQIAASLGYNSAGSARNQKYKCLERIRKQVATP
jgi:RNA polymerase sigma factor (sigma-70 family)